MFDPDPAIAGDTQARREFEAEAPVTLIAMDPDRPAPIEGIGICVSGGGYRAMLFHLGSFWRLNDAGILRRAKRISSVSGGSITAARLGLAWTKLGWDDATNVGAHFRREVADPILALAGRTIDVPAIFLGLPPFYGTGNRIAKKYDRRLYHGATLQDLPADSEGPRFVINATNLQSGVLWRFSRAFMADYTVGLVPNPKVSLGVAVAASAGFPPLLSPVRLRVDPRSYAPDDRGRPLNADHRERIILTDGGVYDNMGLEAVWKRCRTVLVSDAGGGGGWWDPGAAKTWLHQFWRVFWIQRYQVGRIRRRQLISSFQHEGGDAMSRDGAYWGIGSEIDSFRLDDALPAPAAATHKLRDVPTRLKAMPPTLARRLVNWGYAACDAAIRKHVDRSIPRPGGFPFPEEGVG